MRVFATMMFYLKWKHRYLKARGGGEQVKENRIRYSFTFNVNVWHKVVEQKSKEQFFLPFLQEWGFREHLKSIFMKVRNNLIKNKEKIIC